MTCLQCEKAQDKVLLGDEEKVYPVRIGRATILILACPIHAKWAMEHIRRGKLEEEKDEASSTSVTVDTPG